MNPSNHNTNASPRDSLYASALSEPPLLDIGGEEEREKGGVAVGGARTREEDHGLAVIELCTLHFYLVSGYRGDRNHDYVCAYVSS